MYKRLVRENILALKPYSSARDEFSGDASVFLDANENPFNNPYNRYPDPLAGELKKRIAELKHLNTEQIFTGNGSDEAIDLLLRIFCEPGKDEVISIDPSYGMYQVAADINNVHVNKIKLTGDFQPDVDRILDASRERTKLLFLCSPNNPTANSLDEKKVLELLEQFPGMVIIDEAYIDFSVTQGFSEYLNKYENLVILQTLSKAWGLAGLRLGMAFAHPGIISLMNKVKYPYNINILTQRLALAMLGNEKQKNEWVKEILEGRNMLSVELPKFRFVRKVFPSDANFLLVKVDEPVELYQYLTTNGIIVRDRSSVTLCEGCLRITVGTPDENKQLINCLLKFHPSAT
jgi:histidinol-phosphate aminotransferase